MNYITPTTGDVNIYNSDTVLCFNCNKSTSILKGNESKCLRILSINVQLAVAILKSNKYTYLRN
jgi:hypothetical protein